MKIGLIDVDGHNFPNLALMKISAYTKNMGHTVGWYDENAGNYDEVYMSKVFSDIYTPDYTKPIHAEKITRGGTGYCIELKDGKEIFHPENNTPLPYEVEHTYPDYSLYPQYTGYGKSHKQQTAYGFLTRGCPRGCGFCHVAPKEGRKSMKVANLDEFWNGQGNICLSDPNILACKESPELLQQLIESKAKVEFNQGLDARLIDEKKAKLLASINLKLPHFAMDSMSVVEPVKKGLQNYVNAYKEIHGKWNWRNAKVFVLTNYDTTFEEDMERIRVIQECECWAYVMIYNKPSAPSIIRRLQRWTNNAICYGKTHDFMEYQEHNYKTVLTN